MKLSLWFELNDGPELVKAIYSRDGLAERTSYRRKAVVTNADAGSFQWTVAVRGFALLAVASLHAQSTSAPAYVLEGDKGSLAASLDYAISKPTSWILDLFGQEKNGKSAAPRVFRRENSERKLPGPVRISFSAGLAEGNLQIYLGTREVKKIEELRTLLKQLDFEAESISAIPTSSPWFAKPWFREVLTHELRRCLAETELLEPLGIKKARERIKNFPWAKKTSLASDLKLLEKNFPKPQERYSNNLEQISGKFPKSILPLKIAAVPHAFGSLAIIRHLQINAKFPIELDFSYPSTSAISLGEDESQCMVLSWGAVSRRAQDNAKPLLLMPRTSIDLVVPEESDLDSKKIAAVTLALDPEGYPSQFIEAIRSSSSLLAKDVRLSEASLSEILTGLAELPCGAVLGFPYADIAKHLHGMHLVAIGDSRLRVGDNVLVVGENVPSEAMVALQHGVRAAWYSLLEDAQSLNQVIDSFLEDQEYLRYLTRLGGLYRYL